jgi:hypothetical protein
MDPTVSWIIMGVCALVIIFSGARGAKSMQTSLAFQDEARKRGEKLLELNAETNQLLRELIAEVRSKR